AVCSILERKDVEAAQLHVLLLVLVLPFRRRRDVGDGGTGACRQPVNLSALQLLGLLSGYLDAHIRVREDHEQARLLGTSGVVEAALGKRSGLDDELIRFESG